MLMHLKRHICKSHRFQLGIIFAAICLVAACSKHDNTYTGEVSRFETRVRGEMDVDKVQAWAIDVLRTNRAPARNGSEDSTSVEISQIPETIRKLNQRTPVVYAFVNTSEDKSYVAIRWGDGFSGHWGFNIGTTKFEDFTGPKSEKWRPGIYFWREHRL